MPTLTEPVAAGIGGKARNLLDLQLAGFPVPEFLCSPASAAEATRHLGAPVAVRSSASAEDSPTASFAGQFQTFLNLHTVSEVEGAVQACRDSLTAPTVLDYCRRAGIDPTSLEMGVIVQRMVEPELAGVAFTVNPSTGAEEVVIEACEGLADELLAGHRPALPEGHPLLERHRSEIERTARAIHRHFGCPQDLEFAIERGRLFILQSRPVTRIQFTPSVGEWTNADFRDGGVSCTVCTPLMWSLYDSIWNGALKGFLREIRLLRGDFEAGRMFFGRPYWNLGEVKKCLARLPGFVEREFDADLGVHVTYEGNGITNPASLAKLLRAVPAGLAIESAWKRQARIDRELLEGGFETRIQEFRTVPDDPSAALARLVAGPYRLTETHYFRTIYCASLAKLDLLKAFPEAADPALVSALPPLRHLDPTRMIREMARSGTPDIARIQRTFAHRGRRELDLRAPRWDEDDEWVRAMVEMPAAPATPDLRSSYQAARRQLRAAVPPTRRRAFDRKLDRLRHFLWLREEMRDLSSRVYHLIRRHVLAIAEERNLGDDVFFMTLDEVLADDRSRIRQARDIYESYRNFKAPNEVGARFTFTREGPAGALRGIPASRGKVRGRVRVARSVEEALHAAEGEILVCPFTDPGWTPVLDRVAGVITETGGLLSHAAVICREFGIPAVLGVPDATVRLAEGTLVTLNGDDGSVETGASPATSADDDATTGDSEAAAHADFTRIRYAQCWEDADVLLAALDIQPGHRCISIASAGDNSLAMLARDPEQVVAIDLNPSQLACLELRVAAYRELEHPELLELMGSRPSSRRAELYRRCRSQLGREARSFWDTRADAISRGIGGAGKFERYFELFRRRVLPLVHSRRKVERLLQGGPPDALQRFYAQEWDTWRWQLMFRLFFSRFVMGRAGRDPSFFRYVEGSVAGRILERTRHALTALDPADNPYLQWILTGTHTTALPFALRPENFDAIRSRLDRLEWRQQPLEGYLDSSEADSIDALNLSDIFEYMSPENHHRLLEAIVRVGRPGARLAYWNTLAERRRPDSMADCLRSLEPLQQKLHLRDKAFFYCAFRVEEVLSSR